MHKHRNVIVFAVAALGVGFGYWWNHDWWVKEEWYGYHSGHTIMYSPTALAAQLLESGIVGLLIGVLAVVSVHCASWWWSRGTAPIAH